MENMEKHIREQLAEHEIAPPAGFWHQISDALDKQELSENKMTVLPQTKSWVNRGQILRIAAALIFLIGIGGIIRVLQIKNGNAHETTVATSADTEVNTAPAQPVVVEPTIANAVNVEQVQKTVATNKKPKQNIVSPAVQRQVVEKNEHVESAIHETITEETAVAQKTEDSQSVIPNSTEVSTNSVPVYSLKLLDKNVPDNDEITVIEKDPKKVIVIEKGLSKKPEIRYQLPLRF